MTDAHLHVEIVAWLAAAAILYAAGVRRARRRRPGAWPMRRAAAFAAGLLAALVALASPLAWRGETLLSAHMLQHLVLTLVAAPLVVLGAPVSLALQASRGHGRRRLAAIVRSRAVRLLTHPLVAWSAFAATMLATHLTGFYDLALRSSAAHALEHGLYIATALLFWLPVLGINPVRRLHGWLGRTLYLLTAMTPMSAISAALVYADAPRYPSYAASARGLGVSALHDQQVAGAYMWVFGSMLMVGATVVLGWEALVREERRQQALDALEAGA
jgi:putative membrane protein